LNNKPIGFASYDPRQKPVAIIGHNCIIPRYQKQGFGKQQLMELLNKLQQNNFNQVKVSTGDCDFFLPAQKLYLSCGFSENKRFPGKYPEFQMIEFVKEINNNPSLDSLGHNI
jgi:GNAT superfamily N-acetyltransferase